MTAASKSPPPHVGAPAIDNSALDPIPLPPMADDSAEVDTRPMDVDDDDFEGQPLTLNGMMDFFAEQALYRGISAVDEGNFSGSFDARLNSFPRD